jgi:hypothetical protein
MALKGEQMKGLAMKDPKRLYNTANEKFFKDIAANHETKRENNRWIISIKQWPRPSAVRDYIYQQSKLRPSKTTYPLLNWVKVCKPFLLDTIRYQYQSVLCFIGKL